MIPGKQPGPYKPMKNTVRGAGCCSIKNVKRLHLLLRYVISESLYRGLPVAL